MSAEEHPQTNPLIPKQSRTPYHISGKPEKQDLVHRNILKGQSLSLSLRVAPNSYEWWTDPALASAIYRR